MNVDGVTEFAKLNEPLHPAVDVHFIFFPYVQAVDCLLRVWLHLQLKMADSQNISNIKTERKSCLLCFN